MKKTRVLRILLFLVVLMLLNRAFGSFWEKYSYRVLQDVSCRIKAQAQEQAGNDLEYAQMCMVDGSYMAGGKAAVGPFSVPVVMVPHSAIRYEIGGELNEDGLPHFCAAYLCINDANGFAGYLWSEDSLTKSKLPKETVQYIFDDFFPTGANRKNLPVYHVTKYCFVENEVVPLEITKRENGKDIVFWSTDITGPETDFHTSETMELGQAAILSGKKTFFGTQAVRFLTEGNAGIYQSTLIRYNTYFTVFEEPHHFSGQPFESENKCMLLASPLRGRVWFFVFSLILAVVLFWALERFLSWLENSLYRNYYRPAHETVVVQALAHDLKTSFMVIEGSAENLAAGVSAEKEQVFLTQMNTETARVRQVLTKMEQFRQTADLSECTREPVELNALIYLSAQRYEELAKERGIRFAIEEKAGFVVMADHDLMDMVVDNFVHNAVKYAKENTEVKICIWEKKVQFQNEWEPMEEYRKYPERFFQAYNVGNNVRGASRGSGVGLAIAANVLSFFKLSYRAVAKEEVICFEIQK